MPWKRATEHGLPKVHVIKFHVGLFRSVYGCTINIIVVFSGAGDGPGTWVLLFGLQHLSLNTVFFNGMCGTA